MVAEGSVDVVTLVVLSTLFGVIVDERLLVKGGCTHRDGGRLNGVSWAYEGDLNDKRVLCRCQDEPELSVLESSTGTLNWRRVCGEETVCVSDGRVVWFLQLVGEGWGQEAVGDSVDQLGVCHPLFSIVFEL